MPAGFDCSHDERPIEPHTLNRSAAAANLLSDSIDALRQQWLRLVKEYARARRRAEEQGTEPAELEVLDLSYNLRIDLAFMELKVSESLEHLRSALRIL